MISLRSFFLLVLGFFLLGMVDPIYTTADENETINQLDMSQREPSYEVLIMPEKFYANPGEEISIEISYSGQGDVGSAKILLTSDTNVTLRDPEKDSGTSHSLAILNPSHLFAPTGPNIPESEASFLVAEVGGTFTEKIETVNGSIQGSGARKPHNERIFVSNEPGDHLVRAVLSYSSSEGDWKTSKDVVTIHVNSWSERHQRALALVAIFLAALAVLAASLLP